MKEPDVELRQQIWNVIAAHAKTKGHEFAKTASALADVMTTLIAATDNGGALDQILDDFADQVRRQMPTAQAKINAMKEQGPHREL